MQERTDLWEIVLSTALVGVGLAVWFITASFPPPEQGIAGPALFPRVLATGMIVGGVFLGLSALRDVLRAPARGAFLQPSVIKVLATLLIVVLVPFLMRVEYIGLVGSTGIGAFAFSLLIGTGVVRAALVGVSTVLVVYFLFGQVLGVPLQ